MTAILKPVFFFTVLLGLGACATTQPTTQEALDPQTSLSDSALFYYGGDSVLAEDFLYVYLKNHQDSLKNITQDSLESSVREYLNLYINFKLKVKAAYQEGLHRETAFVKEFNQYQEQLAKPYMAENRFKEKMVQQAYERMSEEIHASHILISVPEGSEDTLAYYRKADSLRQLAVNGASFAMLAEQHSEDPSAPQNGGSLGYFTAMQMVYPFENVAYQTKTGDISRPVRTQFGYHIIKVHDKRPAQGSVKVAHIMIRHEEGEPRDQSSDAYAKATKIYEELQSGAEWNEMTERYSEDVSTRNNGGELPYFGTGGMLKEFEEAAFALDNEGDISPPVSTRYGWHILKLVDRKGLEPLETLRPGIERKVQRILQETEIQQRLIDMLKKENDYQVSEDNLEKLWVYLQAEPEAAKPDSDMLLFELENKPFTFKELNQYLREKKITIPLDSAEARQVYYGFEEKYILDNEEANLLEKYPEYRRLLSEYKEGILLFNIMERKVWNTANTDTQGLRDFYTQHQQDYRWNERADATIFEAKNAVSINEISTRLDGERPSQDLLEDLRQEFNKEDPLNLQVYQGMYEKEEERGQVGAVLDEVAWKTGVYELKQGQFAYLVMIHDIREPTPKDLNEIKGLVVADYQQQLDKAWVQELRKRHSPKIDERVLKQLIQKIEYETE